MISATGPSRYIAQTYVQTFQKKLICYRINTKQNCSTPLTLGSLRNRSYRRKSSREKDACTVYIIYKIHINLKNECIMYYQPLLFCIYIYMYRERVQCLENGALLLAPFPEKTLRGDELQTSKKFSDADLQPGGLATSIFHVRWKKWYGTFKPGDLSKMTP